MEQLSALQACYARYEETVTRLYREAPAFAGFWGWGDDPRNDPCHARFYEDVGAIAEAIAASGSEEAAVYQAARWLLEAPAKSGSKDAVWFEYAAQSHCGKLIPLLTAEHCAELVRLFEECYPKRERLPAQRELHKRLRQAAGK